MTPQEFVAKWKNVTLKESAASQTHFNDLCRLVGHPTPVDDDPTGTRFTFEAGAGKGWADVWKRGYFAVEYKGKHANLDKAYEQLLRYKDSLENPPLLVVSDMDKIIIHSNFTNTVKRVETITLDDILIPSKLSLLKAMFYEPERFKSTKTTEQATEEAAAEFAKLAILLGKWEKNTHQVAHFLIRLLFCLFAEDIELLPPHLFTRLITQTGKNTGAFTKQLRLLFDAMSTGGYFGTDEIKHFDGGLFEDDFALELDSEGIGILIKVSSLDWSSIEPSILGTLFERSLDPEKRSQLGAHYTSKEDILLIVEPVVMAPLRRRWEEVKAQAKAKSEARDQARGGAATRLNNELSNLLLNFAYELCSVRILDPACGSGNFLYVALKQLLDLWKEVSMMAGELGLPLFTSAVAPTPEQLYGIEVNPYAHELAQATVWIGYIQWLKDNGFGTPSEPILRSLDNIINMDAILAYDENGQPIEPEWPEADYIIGNPPFLGWYKLRQELGDNYVNNIRQLYDERVPGGADLVTYWFEHTRSMIEAGRVHRAGLLATQGIRGGANRRVLERIKTTGDIFMAWSDRPWILDGAAVRISIIGFDSGAETERTLDGKRTSVINSDLTGTADLTTAQRLQENQSICYLGSFKFGPFDIQPDVAASMLSKPLNPNGQPNSVVVKPWVNAWDITRRPRGMWIIDFGNMSETEASLYEAPFEYVRTFVKPERDKNRRARRKKYWWQHGETSPGLYTALKRLEKYIVTPHTSKHRLFVWLDGTIIPDHALVVFARDDNYFFGVLHSKPHELWALRLGTSLEDRPRYTPTSIFETFPFPWPPGKEPKDDPRVEEIAAAARELVEKRDRWLNPEGASEAELKKRTLTNLYNQRPTWLALAHEKLDRAVFAAYGWEYPLSDEEILERLLALNLERASKQGEVITATAGEEE